MTLLTTPTIRSTATPLAVEDLLRARDRLPAGHPDRAELRDRAVEAMLPLAHRLARRYAGRGEQLDDLTQVAALALVRAVDGFDTARLVPFVGYAVPSIVGALKRHFRDSVWDLRVPRGAQQLGADLRVATCHLEQLRGRTPTRVELATHLRVDAGTLADAVNASRVFRLGSLNAPRSAAEDTELLDRVGFLDARLDRVDDRLSNGVLGRLVAALPPKSRQILVRRFADEMTQERIAAELGMSQMHVSRLLRRAIEQLRAGMAAEPARV
ncbi:sigma-70 family RNA polymerase sigma factor [Dactylosporangium sp. NPDC049525]|uniref:sigma-70 family RNA polymerase sigma factor n=1 Tax=Dactylosporangium sp. NPDC049525 TaxID=3154730 RepID=UPI00341971AB